MAGISDRALAFGKVNKYRFQKQELQSDEFSDHSGLDMYEFKYRFDDPQIGRFWTVDPLASDCEYNSPYAFSEDKVTGHIELEGLEAMPVQFASTSFRRGRSTFSDCWMVVTSRAKGYQHNCRSIVSFVWTREQFESYNISGNGYSGSYCRCRNIV
jgi:hypothetical protein